MTSSSSLPVIVYKHELVVKLAAAGFDCAGAPCTLNTTGSHIKVHRDPVVTVDLRPMRDDDVARFVHVTGKPNPEPAYFFLDRTSFSDDAELVDAQIIGSKMTNIVRCTSVKEWAKAGYEKILHIDTTSLKTSLIAYDEALPPVPARFVWVTPEHAAFLEHHTEDIPADMIIYFPLIYKFEGEAVGGESRYIVSTVGVLFSGHDKMSEYRRDHTLLSDTETADVDDDHTINATFDNFRWKVTTHHRRLVEATRLRDIEERAEEATNVAKEAAEQAKKQAPKKRKVTDAAPFETEDDF